MVLQPVASGEDAAPRHHVAIAGTGRAGTSFLVRFLGQCGLDVGSLSDFDHRARAGLENHLLDRQAPYVVKDPWLFAYCERIDPEVVAVDALLVPVRDLMSAATSRVLQERIAMAQGPWIDWPHSDVHGSVLAGAVYSIDPVDQARILAVGFHRLIHWATARQVPLFLLEFPHAVTDAEYLIETLWPWLGRHCDREQAGVAFSTVSAPHLVRITDDDEFDTVGTDRGGSATGDRLDREAMAILLKERTAQLTDTEEQLTGARRLLQEAQTRVMQVEGTLEQRSADLAIVQTRIDTLDDRMGRARAELDAMRLTVSWRITRPLRGFRRLSKHFARRGRDLRAPSL